MTAPQRKAMLAVLRGQVSLEVNGRRRMPLGVSGSAMAALERRQWVRVDLGSEDAAFYVTENGKHALRNDDPPPRLLPEMFRTEPQSTRPGTATD